MKTLIARNTNGRDVSGQVIIADAEKRVHDAYKKETKNQKLRRAGQREFGDTCGAPRPWTEIVGSHDVGLLTEANHDKNIKEQVRLYTFVYISDLGDRDRSAPPFPVIPSTPDISPLSLCCFPVVNLPCFW